MSPRAPRCTYFMVDVEATGPVPGLYSMVSLAAVVLAPTPEGSHELGAEYYAELRPAFGGHQPEANAVHGLDIARLERDGLEPKVAMEGLSAFVAQHTLPGSEATFVAHVAVFDWMYVAWYYAWCGLENPFGYKGLDTKALAMGKLDLAWPDTGKEILHGKLGLEPQEEATLHRADADARHQALLLKALLEYERR